jgi:hypothetical protein
MTTPGAPTPISQLPAATQLSGTELVPVSQVIPNGLGYYTVHVPSAAFAVLGTPAALPWGVSVGGTGQSSFFPNGVLYGAGSSALQAVPAGTTGQVLTANTGAAPSWMNLAAAITAFITGLPTTLPATPGQLWLNGGVLSVS